MREILEEAAASGPIAWLCGHIWRISFRTTLRSLFSWDVWNKEETHKNKAPNILWKRYKQKVKILYLCPERGSEKFLYIWDMKWEHLGRIKQIWYLLPMRAAKVQASLRICAVSPGPRLLTHTSNESRETFRQKARSLAPLNGWACAVKICHDGMLEDTYLLAVPHVTIIWLPLKICKHFTVFLTFYVSTFITVHVIKSFWNLWLHFVNAQRVLEKIPLSSRTYECLMLQDE